ncbi:Sin3 associated polypeptide p18-domain-containing protein [Zychaea mexicana]|uniref:Sin3 associated polypeptide p18-domain-containing protein n=1 Tax=Zychaea mexicana TaxID=64656 RepID=UPI0022FEE844|nr:Sin3 associated polypeptide p18-domain-containing protein [Zychaea mexicana]KAI9493288.1 Sin3 associated polypeptide p18-domain-containing protein [Zychaea mexicana]
MSTTIDREKECPFLLRIFTRNGGHHTTNEFQVDSVPTSDELQLYTWRNATLEELAQLIQEVVPEAKHPDARVAFRLIYLDSQRAVYRSRDIGRVVNIKPTADQTKTLDDCNFFIGDFLDVAIYIGPPPINKMRRNSDWGRDGGNGARDRRPGGRFGSGGARDGRFRRDDRPFGGRRDRF